MMKKLLPLIIFIVSLCSVLLYRAYESLRKRIRLCNGNQSPKKRDRFGRVISVALMVLFTSVSLLNTIFVRNPVPVNAATNSGIVVYSERNQTLPRYAIWDGSAFGTEQQANSASNNHRWIQFKRNPQATNDFIMASVGNNSNIFVQTFNGTSWTSNFDYNIRANTYRKFDIAFEDTNGDAIAVYGDNTSQLKFRKRVSGTWDTTESNAGSALSGVPQWVRAESKPGDDDIFVSVITANGNVHALRWNGSSWDNQTQMTNGIASVSYDGTDIAFEADSGDAWVLWGDSSGNLRYREFTSSWQTEGSAYTSLGSNANWVVADFDPDTSTSDIAVGMILANGNLGFGAWNGSSWVSRPTDSAGYTGSTRILDVAYGTNSNQAVYVFNLSASSNQMSYRTYDTGSGFSSVTTTSGTSGSIDTFNLAPDPFSNDVMALYQDANSDLFHRKWTGSWSALGTAVETEMSNAGIYEAFHFDWSTVPTVTISGVCKEYDQTTNCADGQTVRVAVNANLQDQTATTSSGTFTLDTIVQPTSGDVITVFLDGVADASEAVAVAKYDGTGSITGIILYTDHLTIGSDDNQTITNANLANYDNSVSGDEDIFFEVDTNNDLVVDYTSQSTQEELYILVSNTYQPDSASSGNVTTHSIEIDGTFVANGNTINVAGNWDNDSTFTAGTSVVNLNGAAASTQTITGATTFYDLSVTTSSARTVEFEASTTFTISADGDLTWTGGSCNAILSIRSTTTDTQFTITRTTGGSGTNSIQYVGLRDSNATNSLTANNSNNIGNNTNWTFSGSCNVAPVVTNVTVNGGSDVSLTEATTTSVSWTATVTDTNGYTDINNVAGKLYRSGVSGAEACTIDNNSCYEDTVCTLSSCSGNSCTATCTVSMQFHADPTDTGSVYSSEYWRGWMEATDTFNAVGTAFSAANSPDVESLRALSVDAAIGYGSLLAGDNSGAVNQTVTITNTGNTPIDSDVSGSDMCTDFPACSASSFAVTYQQYSLSSFSYGSGTSLTSSSVKLDINLAKPTSAPSSSSTSLYWGIEIPSIQGVGTYSGENTIAAVTDT